ncbi:hypothetical protein [Sphingomonas sp.]|uniref:hypothetical protein n=1 Tax=Sphingomonas sp. TaxID=28214 RepID=UPI002DD6A4C7|nr:hypothetical protein [Sphingomonas sp.]
MMLRILAGLSATTLALGAAAPAKAQFFFKSPDLRGPVVDGTEPGMIAQPLPGATPNELKAALAWNLRAALNVAALQCQFAPMLMTLPNYNKLLKDHAVELDKQYDVLEAYFKRVNKTPKAGQTALDQYGTRVYSSYSTVMAQLTFCQTAGEISHMAVFTPRGSFTTLAQERLRQMRNSLVLAGEQRFYHGFHVPAPAMPRFDDVCWRRDQWQPKKCGALNWPPA